MENKPPIQKNKNKLHIAYKELEEKINIINEQQNVIKEQNDKIKTLYNKIEKSIPKCNSGSNYDLDKVNMGYMAQISEPTTSKLVQANLDLAIAITEEINLLSNHVYSITGKDINTSVARTSNISTHVINQALYSSNQNFDWILSKFRELNTELSKQLKN